MDFRAFFIPQNRRNSDVKNVNFRLFRVFFFSENGNPKLAKINRPLIITMQKTDTLGKGMNLLSVQQRNLINVAVLHQVTD
jgi:hypothetical protein